VRCGRGGGGGGAAHLASSSGGGGARSAAGAAPASHATLPHPPPTPHRARAADNCRDKIGGAKAPFKSAGAVFKVTFLGLGDQKVVIDCPDNSYILDAADKAGVDLPATCRGGICGACVGRVAKGAVDQSDVEDLSFTMDEAEQAQGMALLCMSRPVGDVEIETQCDWGYSLGVAEWKGATGKFSARPDPLMGSDGWKQQ
jgi:2Fe-2S type ferredoxin